MNLTICAGCGGTKKRVNRKGKLAKCSACIGSGKPLDSWTEDEIHKYRQAFIKSTLRKASYRWPYRNLAMQKARVGWGLYKCAHCGKSVTNKIKKLDHVNPVVDPRVGFVSWDEFGKRELVGLCGWQVLCEICHNVKSKGETEIRKQTRRQKKMAGGR